MSATPLPKLESAVDRTAAEFARNPSPGTWDAMRQATAAYANAIAPRATDARARLHGVTPPRQENRAARRRRPRGRRVAALGTIAASVAGLASLGIAMAPAGAAGILPPGNPPANINPSSSDFLTSINNARAQEGVGPLGVTETELTGMSIPEQIFTIINYERIDRGLPPISYLTSQLDAIAQGGADAGTDPSLPSTLSGGAQVTWAGSIWAGGISNVLEADYYWMYDDGYSTSGTSNIACSPSTPSECWGHRDIILHSFAGAPVLSMGSAYSATGHGGGSLTAALAGSSTTPNDIVMTWGQAVSDVNSASRTVGIAPMTNGSGYWEADAVGTVAAFGAAHNYGSVNGSLNNPIVGIAATPDNRGYWLVASDGGIFSFGDAQFYGSTGAIHLNRPIVGITSTPSGHGYWMVASDGGIFAFGDAAFFGSMGGQHLNSPIVGIAADPQTGGYWEVGADGGIFSFNAPFYGSTGALRLNEPIVGIEVAGGGRGYRFVASDGGIFSFGAAPFAGSMGGTHLSAPVTGMASDNATDGYWMAAQDGAIFTFGGAKYLGRITA